MSASGQQKTSITLWAQPRSQHERMGRSTIGEMTALDRIRDSCLMFALGERCDAHEDLCRAFAIITVNHMGRKELRAAEAVDSDRIAWFAFLSRMWDTICTTWRFAMIHWKQIDEFIEPNWEKMDVQQAPPNLFWREAKQAAVLGFIRDGELFDLKWLYVCDSNKVTHFSEVNGPGSNVVELKSFRPDTEI
jgi:hypothetical protein